MTQERIPLKRIPEEFTHDLEAKVDELLTGTISTAKAKLVKLFARVLMWLHRRVKALEESR